MGETDQTMWRLTELIRQQDGVVTRRQVLDCGMSTGCIRTKLRRREWVAFYRGVYVTHNGPVTWRQRAWCAVLDAAPAVLSHESALHAILGGQESGPIHITVEESRSVTRRPGVVVHYRRRLASAEQPNARPPRTRIEEAVLDTAACASSEMTAVARLADPVQARITTADRLIAALGARRRIARRSLLTRVLVDIRDGTLSVLEHGYLTRVERAHGLPASMRQVEITAGRPGLRDVLYEDENVIVELDGRVFHDNAAAYHADLERDLDAAAGEERSTLRAGYGQVFDNACSTAERVGRVLGRRGWAGAPRPCGPGCTINPAGRDAIATTIGGVEDDGRSGRR